MFHVWLLLIEYKLEVFVFLQFIWMTFKNICLSLLLRITRQRRFFCEHLLYKDLEGKAKGILRSQIERLKMSRRNTTKKVDCGVYGMRHMGTYMGQRVQEWECGFKNLDIKKMRVVRAKYCKALITSEFNRFNAKCAAAAKEHMELKIASLKSGKLMFRRWLWSMWSQNLIDCIHNS